MKKILFTAFLFLGITSVFAQERNDLPWFVSAGAGYQHSGIRSEDYVATNFSPLVSLEVGKYFLPYFAITLGYKGPYYNYISDSDKHHYAFLYSDFVLDLRNLIQYRENNKWTIQVYAGGGAFYNRYPDFSGRQYPNGRLMAAGNIGVSFLAYLTHHFRLGIDISSIGGWGIYQDSIDAIPSAFIRGTYIITRR